MAGIDEVAGGSSTTAIADGATGGRGGLGVGVGSGVAEGKLETVSAMLAGSSGSNTGGAGFSRGGLDVEEAGADGVRFC